MCIYIPDELWQDASLSFFERCFLGKILALSRKDGSCWAGDEKLAEYMTVTPSYIRKSIRKLKASGHLKVMGYGQSRKLVTNGTSDNWNKFQMEQNLGQMEHLDGTIGTKVGTIGPQTIETTIENTKETTKESVVLPWESERFEEAWTQWKEYKRDEFRFRFKSTKSEQAQLHRLQTLSGGDETVAIGMIHEAIGQTWKGFYEPKTKNNATKRPGPSDGSLIAEHLRKLAAQSGESLA